MRKAFNLFLLTLSRLWSRHDAFRADNFGIKRLKTGAEFTLTRLPVDLYCYFYANPTLNLKVGFDCVWIVERRLTAEREDTIRLVHARTGAVLVEGQLHRQIASALPARASHAEVKRSVDDCLDLIGEYIRRGAARHFKISIAPRLYEANEGSLRRYLSSPGVDVGPEVVTESGAKQIF